MSMKVWAAITTWCLVMAFGVQAEVPTMMSYQGLITSGGEPVDGTGYFKFALMDTFGAVRWTNDDTGIFPPAEPTASVEVPVDNGLFTVLLGDPMLANMQDLGGHIFVDNTPLSLRIWFSEDNVTFEQLAPDQRIAAAGYAMQAQHVPPNSIGSGQLAPLAVTAFQIANGAVLASKLAPDSVTAVAIENAAVTADKLAANSVTGINIVNSTITSNKIDWTTMPPRNPKSYADNGSFSVGPTASGEESVAIGVGAVASGTWSVVGGGYQNVAGAERATVAGGLQNEAHGFAGTIGGGIANRAAGDQATVAGGEANVASNTYATVGGGYGNRALRQHSTIGGGEGNTAVGSWSSVGGGASNLATNEHAAISGGQLNVAGGPGSFVGGGIRNHAVKQQATVGGGNWNVASGEQATIAGGFTNVASELGATIGGGDRNTASGSASFIGGGGRNRATAPHALVAGGFSNTASGTRSAVGGGIYNLADGLESVVAGGSANTAMQNYSVVSGGRSNVANGIYAMIAGGFNNQATNYSFAAGRNARAEHPGSFVWGDTTEGSIFTSRDNSVVMRAHGGYVLITGSHIGAQLNPNASSWTTASDREAKENFEEIDVRAVLEGVANLPLTAWNYKADPEQRRYIGPVAQDFHAAFGLGNDTTINTLDFDGVALAAIQALYEENQELKARLERLEALLDVSVQ